MSVIGTNFAGATKKTTVNSMAFVAYCISNIVVPQAFLGREAPTYHTGILTVMCFQIALIACYWINWTLMTLDNRKRNKAAFSSSEVEHRQQPAGSDSEVVGQGTIDTEAAHRAKIMNGLKDLTDRENKSFRYAP